MALPHAWQRAGATLGVSRCQSSVVDVFSPPTLAWNRCGCIGGFMSDALQLLGEAQPLRQKG